MPLNAGTGVEVVLTRAGGHQTVSCQVVNGKLGVGRPCCSQAATSIIFLAITTRRSREDWW
jgi:hypothetical protein